LAVIYPIKTQNGDLLQKQLFYLCAFTCDEHEIGKESPVTTPAHVFILAGLPEDEVATRLDSFQKLLMDIPIPLPQHQEDKPFTLKCPTDQASHMAHIHSEDKIINNNFYCFVPGKEEGQDFVMRQSTGGVLCEKVNQNTRKNQNTRNKEREEHQEHSFYTISSFVLQLRAYTPIEVKSATCTALGNGYQMVELRNDQGRVILTFECVYIETNDTNSL
jgi:hypothetical protein